VQVTVGGVFTVLVTSLEAAQFVHDPWRARRLYTIEKVIVDGSKVAEVAPEIVAQLPPKVFCSHL